MSKLISTELISTSHTHTQRERERERDLHTSSISRSMDKPGWPVTPSLPNRSTTGYALVRALDSVDTVDLIG